MKENYTDLVREEQPAYKMANYGATACTSVDLLTLIISRGTEDPRSQQQARQLINICGGSLRKLANSRPEELMVVPGIGFAKAMAVLAALQLGRNFMAERLQTEKLESASEIYEYMYPYIGGLDHEEAWLILMDNSLKATRRIRISVGGLTETAMDIRQIMREALLSQATCIAVCHNHPSGNTLPSGADNIITDRISKACKTMSLYLVDHVIIGDGSYYSYREMGRI